MKKLLIGAALVGLMGGAQAEPLRTLLTKENQLPEKGQLELGALADTQQFDPKSYFTEEVYARYGLFGNLAMTATVPYHEIRFKNGFGKNLSGIGDVGVGFELLPYEDIFRFPYIMPHLEFRLPTGDQDKGMGTGDVSILAGVTVGTRTWECVDWALDASFEHLVTNDPLLKNDTIVMAASIVWNIDEQFAVVGEFSGSDQDYPEGHPYTLELGMVYKPIENLMFGVYGGRTLHMDESWEGTFKVAYSF